MDIDKKGRRQSRMAALFKREWADSWGNLLNSRKGLRMREETREMWAAMEKQQREGKLGD